MAEEEPTAEHGLKLAIKDYPFANDGILIWGAFKGWVLAYVSWYYWDVATVAGDVELQAFWKEVCTWDTAIRSMRPGSLSCIRRRA
uniref:Lipoxygenase domain-containing protein n=1 Tax=Triticum urartu TaxID=4572 RepID=A0A8R7V3Q0_TRIUA